MERTATHDGEYVDIVLGYQHILAFSLVFGALIFGTGYFVGYYRARTEPPTQRVSESAAPQPAATVTPTSADLPVIIPSSSPQGDILKDMETEAAGKTALSVPAASHDGSAATAAISPEPPPAAPVATAKESVTPELKTPEPPAAKKQAAPPAEPPKKKAPQAKLSTKKTAPPPASAAAKPTNRGGNIYLQMSSFKEPQEAQRLIDDLASDGIRALVDKQLVGGRNTVLVGPFSDFKTALGKAKELKDQNHQEVFPIRR